MALFVQTTKRTIGIAVPRPPEFLDTDRFDWHRSGKNSTKSNGDSAKWWMCRDRHNYYAELMAN